MKNLIKSARITIAFCLVASARRGRIIAIARTRWTSPEVYVLGKELSHIGSSNSLSIQRYRFCISITRRSDTCKEP